MARLHIRLFGGLEFSLNHVPIVSLSTAKARALLAYLAAGADRSHRRESLTGLLWPAVPEVAARASLRQALYHLRRAIDDATADPAFLLITMEDIQYNLSSDTWLDVWAYDQLLLTCRAHAHADLATCGACMDRYRQAVDLYRGSFMAGFSLPGCPDFEEWILNLQEAYHNSVLQALETLVAYAEFRGDAQQAIHFLRRQVELEPWREHSHRQLMRFLAVAGQRGSALHQYDLCRKILAVELGVEPAQETKDLHDLIQSGRFRRSAVAIQTGATPAQPMSFPFVARQEELSTLWGHLHSALAGNGHVVFVSGEAGSGKTALLQEFARRATHSHSTLLVVEGSCYDKLHRGEDGLQPFAEALGLLTGASDSSRLSADIEQARRLQDALPSVLADLLVHASPLIGSLLPAAELVEGVKALSGSASKSDHRVLDQLLRLVDESSPEKLKTSHLPSDDLSIDGTPHVQPFVFDRITSLLRAVAQHHPLLIALDDLQWADHPSICLLFHLAMHLAGSRILVLGAYRPEEVAPELSLAMPHQAATEHSARHPLADVIDELKQRFGPIVVDLDTTDGQAFVEELVGSLPNQFAKDIIDALYSRTEGHPLFTVELLNQMHARSELRQDAAGQWVASQAIDWAQIPLRTQALIAGRIAVLPLECQRWLEAASVQGDTFVAEVVSRVMGVPEEQLIAPLSNTVGHRYGLVHGESVIWHRGRQLSSYRFRHHLYQAHIYNAMDDAVRAHYHAATARALEELELVEAAEADGFQVAAVHMARHHECAHNHDAAVAYLVRAGNQALARYDYSEAAAYFTHGLALLRDLPKTEARGEMELSLNLASAVPLMASRCRGSDDFARACHQAYELSLRYGSASQAIQALYHMASLDRAMGDYRQSLNRGAEMRALARFADDPSATTLAEVTLGTTYWFRGELCRAQSYLTDAVALHDHTQTDHLTAVAGAEPRVLGLALLALTLLGLGYPDQARLRAQEAVSYARALGQPMSLALALLVAKCILARRRGDPGPKPEDLRELQELATRHNLAGAQPWITFFCGVAQSLQGDCVSGVAQMREGMAALQATGVVSGLVLQLTEMAEICAECGLAAEGLGAVDEALTTVEQTGERNMEPILYRVRGDLLQNRGDGQEAEECYLRAVRIARNQKARLWELRAALHLSELWQRQGRTNQSRASLAAVYSWFTEGLDLPDLGRARNLLQAHAEGAGATHGQGIPTGPSEATSPRLCDGDTAATGCPDVVPGKSPGVWAAWPVSPTGA